MAIDTFTIKFNEYELETILARCNSIDDKISDAFANQ